jgi:hypothetical protein
MKRLPVLLCLLSALSICASAAGDYDKFEVSGAYSHLTPGKDGFDLSGGYLPNKYLTLDVDGGAYFKKGDNTGVIMAGPKAQASTRDGWVTGFIDILFGGVHERGNFFAYSAGGGVDVGKGHFAARFKADLIHYDNGQHGRFGIGGVYRW